jgi:hypothetical protein
LRLRFPLVLIAALSAFAIPAGSAFASLATFASPTAGATISQNQTLAVDTNGVVGAAGVDFYVDNAGTPGMYIGGYSVQQSDPTSAQAAPYSTSGGVDSYQVAIGGWANGPVTFDAVIVDSTFQTLATISRSVTIDNTLAPLVRGSFLPSASSTKSGTIVLSLAPSDQNNVITAGSFSVDGGDTTSPLTSDGNGHWSAPVDTIALGVPNGALDIRVHLEDAAGNTLDTDIFYTVGNPQAPVITPNTLVADKSMYRTDETSLEVGDIVEAYGMQAAGYPAPTVAYLWNVCRGQICNGITPGPDGSYTVQAADEGADLTLVATASNGVNPMAFTLVDLGVIAPAYVAPVDNVGGFGDGPQSGGATDPTPAPTPAPPVATPPVVTPPIVTPPIVTPPIVTPPVVVTASVVTPTEQKVIDVAQKTVTTEKTAVVKAEKKVAAAKKKLAVALKALATGTATASEKAAVVAARAVVASRAAAAKAVTKSLVVAKKKLAAKKAAALKS